MLHNAARLDPPRRDLPRLYWVFFLCYNSYPVLWHVGPNLELRDDPVILLWVLQVPPPEGLLCRGQ